MVDRSVDKGKKSELKTLVDRLREIDNTLSNSTSEKEVACKKVIAEFLTNRFVYGAVKGDINILEVCQNIIDRYGGDKNYYPNYIDKEDITTIQELEAIVGPLAVYRTKGFSGSVVVHEYGLSNGASLGCNPIVGGAIGIVCGGGFCYSLFTGRRRFLKRVGAGLGFGLLFGLSGLDSSIECLSKPQKSALENARYAQMRIPQLYPTYKV